MYNNSVTGQDYLDTLREREEDQEPTDLEILEARNEFEVDNLIDLQNE